MQGSELCDLEASVLQITTYKQSNCERSEVREEFQIQANCGHEGYNHTAQISVQCADSSEETEGEVCMSKSFRMSLKN